MKLVPFTSFLLEKNAQIIAEHFGLSYIFISNDTTGKPWQVIGPEKHYRAFEDEIMGVFLSYLDAALKRKTPSNQNEDIF